MEKGALLPLRFYPALSWTDYEKYIKNAGGDFVLLREHSALLPAFQMTMPDIGRHWGRGDFIPDTFQIHSYETQASVENLGQAFYSNRDRYCTVYNKAGEFRSFVFWRTPLNTTAGGLPTKFPDGLYYYYLSDGETEWYSEVFQLCDLGTNAIVDVMGDETGWANFTTLDYLDEYDGIRTTFCKTATGAGDATAYTELEVFLEEEMDLYVQTQTSNVCAEAAWNAPIYFQFRDADGLVVSDTFTVDTVDTYYRFSIKSNVGGTVRLYMWMDNADTGEGRFWTYLQRRYSAGNNQIRYSNKDLATGEGKNICKIFYEDDYENVFFIDSKQVIDQNVLNENVVEDDLANKYRIVGSNQKWNAIQFASGEAMLNAMSLLRLHNSIKIIRETGEIMDIVEILMEQSVIDYEASTVKLVYREASCGVEACGFDACCPTLGTPIMEEVYDAPGSLPAAAGYSGKYVMVLTAADEYRIYYSNGAAWAVNTTFDIAGDCVEARQNNHTDGNRFFWYDSGASRWRIFIELATVTDNADGTGDLNTDTEYRDGLTIRGEYQGADGVWNECTDPVELTAGGGAIALTTYSTPGVGTWNFRLHAYTSDCDYGYSNVVSQTIT